MYTIVGGNQQPYGPVEADLIRAWVAEGRANGNTIARADDGAWKPLRTFPEFADLFPNVASITASAGAPPPLDAGTPPPFRATPTPMAPSFNQGIPQMHTLSVAGLVCSCLGLLPCCCLPLSLVGLICSVIGYNQLKAAREGEFSTSKSLPLIGIWVGAVGLLLGTVLVVMKLVFGSFQHLM